MGQIPPGLSGNIPPEDTNQDPLASFTQNQAPSSTSPQNTAQTTAPPASTVTSPTSPPSATPQTQNLPQPNTPPQANTTQPNNQITPSAPQQPTLSQPAPEPGLATTVPEPTAQPAPQSEPHWEDDPSGIPDVQPQSIKDPRLAKYKVLIIEDNSDVRYQYEFVLKKFGFNVITASNGEEGIVKAIKERPQIILLDILMPEMDGWAALKALREYTSTYRPKIIILSNLGAPEDIQKAYEMGADMFLIKADTTLLQVVEKIKEMILSESQPSVYVIPLNLQAPEVRQLLKTAPPEVRTGKCPLCGGPIGLKLIPVKQKNPQTGKLISEYNARLVCLKCGKEWV